MSTQRYSVTPHPIETLLIWIKSGEIAIPEIQRPFVWDATKVRNLLDSLYQGYPVGYLIAWRNPTVRLKDGSRSAGKRILIDGQQRVTALMAALLGQQVITKDYAHVRIQIAFHPVEERFEVFNVLDGERTETDLLSGRLDAERLTSILDGSGGGSVEHWFLCGPLPMTDMARETLLARGLTEGHIHRELFHVAGAAPKPRATSAQVKAEGADIRVVLDGRSSTFVLPPSTESILDAARKIREEVPYACKNGVCGTCRCRVVAGTVDMVQNFALEPDEVEKGFVLACQAFPTSDAVTIDFDA